MYNLKLDPIVDADIKDIEDRQVYYYYLNVVAETSKKYYSPFKKEKTPSFRFYWKNSRLLFKCFSSGKQGDCINMVEELYGLDSHEATNKILIDIYGNKAKNKVQAADISAPQIHGIPKYKDTDKGGSSIQVVPRSWTLEDIVYWGNYGLTLTDISHYQVGPCKEVWINGETMWYSYQKHKPCYRYMVGDKYKCYQPFAVSKKGKWISNCRIKNIQGLKQLKEKGILLVITKALKDVMVLNKHLGLNAIALSSESITITDKMSDYFHSRFDNVVLMYDNDEAGIENMKRNSELTQIPYVHLPTHYLEEGIKDPSDLFKMKGKKVFVEEISKILSL